MTGVLGVIIADLAMITAVTSPTKTVDVDMTRNGTEVMTIGITGTDVTDVTVVTDGTGMTATDEGLQDLVIETGGDHRRTGDGGKMTTGDVGRMQNGGRLREGDEVRQAQRGVGGVTLTGTDVGHLRRRGAGQRPEGGMRKTGAELNYANRRRQILLSKTTFLC